MSQWVKNSLLARCFIELNSVMNPRNHAEVRWRFLEFKSRIVEWELYGDFSLHKKSKNFVHVEDYDLFHVVSRAECVSFFDADLRKYVMDSGVLLSDLIGWTILLSKNFLMCSVPGSNPGPSAWQTACSNHYTKAIAYNFM